MSGSFTFPAFRATRNDDHHVIPVDLYSTKKLKKAVLPGFQVGIRGLAVCVGQLEYHQVTDHQKH